MPVKIGNTDISKIFLGNVPVASAYLGDEKVYPNSIIYDFGGANYLNSVRYQNVSQLFSFGKDYRKFEMFFEYLLPVKGYNEGDMDIRISAKRGIQNNGGHLIIEQSENGNYFREFGSRRGYTIPRGNIWNTLSMHVNDSGYLYVNNVKLSHYPCNSFSDIYFRVVGTTNDNGDYFPTQIRNMQLTLYE